MNKREYPSNRYDIDIHVRNFSAVDKFGETKLDIDNLYLPQGTHATITGPSGSGKSILVMAMAGIRAEKTQLAYEGDLFYTARPTDAAPGDKFKKIPADFPLAEQNLSFVPQRPLFDGSMTARDEIMLDLEMKGVKGERKKRLMRKMYNVCAAFEITNMIKKPMSELSGGQQARVLIAGALAIDPNILILDESTANLDQPTKEKVNDALGKIATDFGTTVVMVTHDPLEAPRQIHMVDGRIVEDNR
jgi:ABC-type lipoprotein export system ATPase subunit